MCFIWSAAHSGSCQIIVHTDSALDGGVTIWLESPRYTLIVEMVHKGVRRRYVKATESQEISWRTRDLLAH